MSTNNLLAYFSFFSLQTTTQNRKMKFHFPYFLFCKLFLSEYLPFLCFAFFVQDIEKPLSQLHFLPITFFILPMQYCQNCISNSLCFAFLHRQTENQAKMQIYKAFSKTLQLFIYFQVIYPAILSFCGILLALKLANNSLFISYICNFLFNYSTKHLF